MPPIGGDVDHLQTVALAFATIWIEMLDELFWAGQQIAQLIWLREVAATAKHCFHRGFDARQAAFPDQTVDAV
jgi:hypothetical protein